MKDAGVHVPEAHVVRLELVDNPGNLYLVFAPSVGTVIVRVQDGVAAKLCEFPSKAIEVGLTVQPLTKPVPLGPAFAVEIVTWIVTDASLLNVAEAELPRVSAATTEWDPVDEMGMLNVEVNDPVVEDVTVVGVVGCPTPSYFRVMVDEAANPVPVTVIVDPAIPLIGFRLIDAVMLNIAEAV